VRERVGGGEKYIKRERENEKEKEGEIERRGRKNR
jgi:hypothetical protein